MSEANSFATLLEVPSDLAITHLNNSTFRSFSIIEPWYQLPISPSMHPLDGKIVKDMVQLADTYAKAVVGSIASVIDVHTLASDVISLCKFLSDGSFSTPDIQDFLASMLRIATRASEQARLAGETFRNVRRDLLKVSSEIPSHVSRMQQEVNTKGGERRGGLDNDWVSLLDPVEPEVLLGVTSEGSRNSKQGRQKRPHSYRKVIVQLEQALRDLDELSNYAGNYVDWWGDIVYRISSIQTSLPSLLSSNPLHMDTTRDRWLKIEQDAEIYARQIRSIQAYYPMLSEGSLAKRTTGQPNINPIARIISPRATTQVTERDKGKSKKKATGLPSSPAPRMGGLEGAIKALHEGYMPDNEQIKEGLQYIRTHRAFDINKLSLDGRKLVDDGEKIIDTVLWMLQHKNPDQLFQNFMWHIWGAEVNQTKEDMFPIVKGKVKHDDPQAVRHLRGILFLIATNSKLRKLLYQFFHYGSSLLESNLTKSIGNPQQRGDSASNNVYLEQTTESQFEDPRSLFFSLAKTAITECQKDDNYLGSVGWLLESVEDYVNRELRQDTNSHAAFAFGDSMKIAIELHTLLERFSSKESMNTMFDATHKLIGDARTDEAFRIWCKDLYAHVKQILLPPGGDTNSDSSDIHDILNSGHKFYGKYKEHFDYFFSSARDWFKTIREDPFNKRFEDDWAKLTNDLLFDSDGGFQIKTHIWNDFRTVVLPALVNTVGYIPIPRIQHRSDTLDLVVKNLTLTGGRLLPDIISFEAQFSVPEKQHKFTFTFRKMQAEMHDVSFYYKKNLKGISKWSDQGTANVVIGGKGLSITVQLISPNEDKSSVFQVHNVDVRVDSLKCSIRGSKRDFLHNTISPLVNYLIKKQIQKAIKISITTGMEYVDEQLARVRDHAKITKGKSRSQVFEDPQILPPSGQPAKRIDHELWWSTAFSIV